MKKFVGAAFLAAVFLAPLCAVENSIGVKGGVNIGAGTKYEGKENPGESTETKALVGGGFGIFWRCLPKEHFGFQTGLDFNLRNGMKATLKASGYDYYEEDGEYYDVEETAESKCTYSYTSLDIPILLVADFQFEKFGIAPMAGLNLSIPVGKIKCDGDTTVEFSDGYESETDNEKVDEEYELDNKIVPGMLVGCDFSCRFSEKLAAFFNARYTFDFSKLKGKGKNDTKSFDILTRRAFSASVGLKYTL